MKVQYFAAGAMVLALSAFSPLRAQNSGSATNAHPHGDQQSRITQSVERLTESLELSTEQVVDVRRILEDYSSSIQELHELAEDDREGRKKALYDIQEARKEAMKEVLNEEQFSSWDQMASSRGRARGAEERRFEHSRPNARPGGQGRYMHSMHDPASAAAHMKQEFDLTEDQADAIETFLESQHAKRLEQRETVSAQREKMHQEAQDAFETELRQILTEEQFAAWEKQAAERHAQHQERRRGMGRH